MIPRLLPALLSVQTVLAVNGGPSGNAPFTYTSGPLFPSPGGVSTGLSNPSYEYTGLGAAESNIDFASDGSLIYSPAITNQGVGYATSNDNGSTWQQVLPGGSAQPRVQPVFRKRQVNDRYFYWSSSIPGFSFSYSDDEGKTWTNLNQSHFDTMSQDWAKLVGGRPVRSQLSSSAEEILYYSAPSLISTPIPLQPLGPINQLILKSTDGGMTWSETAGKPTLQPLLSGGACAGLLQSLAEQELIIWGDGFVRPNGTVMYGLRRCQKLSVAISDDEGDSWRLSDVPASSLAPFIVGDLTYQFDGNVLVPEPISQDNQGTIYSIWVDPSYVLRLSRSTDNAQTWSDAIVIGAPGSGLSSNVMAYLPTLYHHPNQTGRAVLSYYGSTDNGKTYNAYIAETKNLGSAYPSWTSIIMNPPSAPMQANQDGMWDQGYGYPLGDLVEFSDVKYRSGSNDVVAAFARRMCTAPSQPRQTYPGSSCVDGWDFNAHAQSQWQGFVAFAQGT
ncbi:Hypothetical predicted protein [Lecanosticta acicola]|uniref:Exo-alpha-sialidase n=1 Tax=Lecanosticta acicola TaxID=111012 RepID=A0AAI9EFX2_9PEZI|nr:Hypothetical predicted protein [Lecanosticta acicola]